MYSRYQGRYALRNRHISHVRFTSLKRGKHRLLVLTSIVIGILILFKARHSHKASNEQVSPPGNEAVTSEGHDTLRKVPISLAEFNHPGKNEVPTPIQFPAPMKPKQKSKWELTPSCDCKKSPPFLLIMIASHASNLATRDVIRNSWCRRKMFPNDRKIVCVFLVGESEQHEELRTDLKRESIKMKDILKGNFRDNFRNSSRKLLVGLEWIKQSCPNVKYVMKTEDDVIVNTKVVMTKLPTMSGVEKNTFIGKCWSDEPNRNPKSRFYVSVDAYPHVGYPSYCSGAGYIMSGDVAKRLYDVSSWQDVLPFDEVYAGILLEKIRVTPTNIEGFIVGRFDESNPCINISSAVAFHVHGMDMQHVWGLLKDCKVEI